jgi:hypothetical protein
MPATNTWDETTPAGSSLVSLGDDAIRQFKLDTRERMALEHVWNVDVDSDGKHKAITIPAATMAANTSFLDAAGYSLTGANTQPAVKLRGTLNTTGAPDVIDVDITNTASGAATNILNYKLGGTPLLRLHKSGALRIGTSTIGNLLDLGGAGDIGMGFLHGPNPGSTLTEGYTAVYGYTSTGSIIKQSSISTHFGDTDHVAGHSVLRLNATYQAAGAQQDYLFLRGWGGKGAGFFAPSDAAPHWPGDKRLKIRGVLHVGDFEPDTGGGVVFSMKTAITGGAAAATISANKGSEGSVAVVSGQSGIKRFVDLVLVSGNSGANVIGASFDLNAPGARTYTVVANNLQLAIAGAADVYTVRVTGMGSDES